MNLVNELQVSAEREDVLTVLRKAQRLASKLGRKDITEWLKYEQEGYPSGHEVPEYRKVGTVLAYNSNGYLPAGYGRIKSGIEDVPGVDFAPDHWVRESISDLLASGDQMGGSRGLYVPIGRGSEEERMLLRVINVNPEFSHQISFLLRLNPSQVKAIPEKVKNRVLTWACDLEAAGVYGENMSFSSDEKRIGRSTSIHIYDSKIHQLTGEGNNFTQTSQGGDNAVSDQGNVVVTRGSRNEVGVNKPKEGVWTSIWEWLKGRFGGGQE